MSLAPLQVETLPLQGRHLIEASAGTGKTYNITRIYLRMLLERQLEVQQILVMTFTRAATEELRGRIAQEIQHALADWQCPDTDDHFLRSMVDRVDAATALPLLRRALLNLDEAAIFTIHGFCKRVLTQQAFASGSHFNQEMESDTAEIELEAVRDWYRRLASQPQAHQQLVARWPGPEMFIKALGKLLSSRVLPETADPEQLWHHFLEAKQQVLSDLLAVEGEIRQALIEGHKERDKRDQEWQALLDWLGQPDDQPMPQAAANSFNGNRFGREPARKARLQAIFEPVKALRESAKEIGEQLARARAYRLAAEGIVEIRAQIRQAKARRRVLNFDDLVEQLAASLEGPGAGLLIAELREQYPVALVDEFQDTDPDQYRILQRLYATHDAGALYMIGDPKQAVYAFRGGDVFAYLDARHDADQQWQMETNWRSSSAMIQGYNRLFRGAPEGQPARPLFDFEISYHPVKSAGVGDQRPLVDSRYPAALQLIDFPLHEAYRSGKSDQMKRDFMAVIAGWCCQEIGRLLSEGSYRDTQGDAPLLEQDIAILVRDRGEAEFVQQALAQGGFPSVYLSNRDNLFDSAEARELLQALRGILEPENSRLLTAALASWLLGCDAVALSGRDRSEEAQEIWWEQQREAVIELRRTWLKRGFMAMALRLLHQHARPDPAQHERVLTNTIHLLELLQQASQQHAEPRQLIGWLEERVAGNTRAREAELRLESDARLIRIVTQHGAKGLEYPVVFIPFASRYKDPVSFGNRPNELLEYHHPETLEKQCFLGFDREARDANRREGHAESLRLLYVAVTRAKQRCYLCAAPFQGYPDSPLGLALGGDAEHSLGEGLRGLLDQPEPVIQLREVAQISFDCQASARHAVDRQALAAARFGGRIERNWWVSSFTALTRNLRHGGVSSPDRDQGDGDSAAPQASLPAETLPIRFSLPKGAAAGNLLHDILEQTDFTAPRWDAVMATPLARFGLLEGAQAREKLQRWLQACLQTPLSSTDGPTLGQLSWRSTLREAEFYFPMEQARMAQLVALLAAHRGEVALGDLPTLQVMQGMMHGFVDLIFEWQGRYYLADYKSTHLGDRLVDYRAERLQENIQQNYYDLQYLIYSLALHRYLRQRLADYDPERHFGGVYYLYLRGMRPGSDSGVYQRSIEPTLLQRLDRLFGGGGHG